MSSVLVMFQADTEHTEQMALAVSVGAVEAEANIRLRRLAAGGAAEVGHKGYGKLQKADLLWADTVVVGLESVAPRAEELDGLLLLLGEVGPGDLGGKKAWTFDSEGLTSTRSEARILVESAMKAAGMVLVSMKGSSGDLIERMKQAGRESVK